MNIPLPASLNRMPAANPPDAKAILKNAKAARDFEALLLTPVLDSLQKTFAGDDDDKTTGASDYRHMATQALGQAIAARGGFGIAQLILRLMQPAKASSGTGP